MKGPEPISLARMSYFFLAATGVTILCYFFVDRQLAEALRPYARGVDVFVWLTYFPSFLVPAASILLAATGLRAASGSATQIEVAILRGACAILIAAMFKDELKFVFGRAWPETWVNNNPSYFGNGTFGFVPFHGGAGYAAFPSGHMTVTGAFAASLWWLWPQARFLAIAVILAVAIGLLGADYHWLSDIVAGTAIGAATGTVASRIFQWKRSGA